MKQIFIFALSLIMLVSCSKEPKEVVLNPLEVNELTNLEVLCQVWGLVKYHHPAFIAGSTHDADADLLELIPKIRGADAVTRNQILLDWINGLGAYSSSKNGWDLIANYKRIYGNTTTPDNIVELSWMEDEYVLGKALSAELPKVRYASRSESSKYVGMGEFNVLSFFEEEYAHITNPSVEYRLLALFRYWNMVEYFYPLKNFLPRHWNNVLTDNIPRLIEATEGLEYRKAMARLLTEAHDVAGGIGDIVPVFGNQKVSPYVLTVSIIEDKLIVTSAATEFQIKRGDEIVSMGGRSLSDMKRLISEYFNFSNQGMLQYLVNYYATATNDLMLSVTYLSDGELKTEDFPTYQYREEPSPEAVSTRAFPVAYTLAEEGEIGYINGAYYYETEALAMMNSFKETKGIIIDLRGYIQSSMSALAYGYFTNSIVWCFDWEDADPLTPGIMYRYSGTNDLYSYDGSHMTYSGKVVILIDETTIAGELSAMLLQTIPGAITIGSQTRGAIPRSSQIVFPGNIRGSMTSQHWSYYNGREVQIDGVQIDLEVKPTIAGIKAGRDELYEKAVELILN